MPVVRLREDFQRAIARSQQGKSVGGGLGHLRNDPLLKALQWFKEHHDPAIPGNNDSDGHKYVVGYAFSSTPDRDFYVSQLSFLGVEGVESRDFEKYPSTRKYRLTFAKEFLKSLHSEQSAKKFRKNFVSVLSQIYSSTAHDTGEHFTVDGLNNTEIRLFAYFKLVITYGGDINNNNTTTIYSLFTKDFNSAKDSCSAYMKVKDMISAVSGQEASNFEYEDLGSIVGKEYYTVKLPFDQYTPQFFIDNLFGGSLNVA